MGHSAIIVRLICGHFDKRVFMFILSPLFLTIKAIECSHDRITTPTFCCCYIHFSSPKVRNLMIFIIMSKAIFAIYPINNFYLFTHLAPPQIQMLLCQWGGDL